MFFYKTDICETFKKKCQRLETSNKLKKIEQEQKVGDEQISRLQSYYKKASEELHHQYEKDRARTVGTKGKA